VDIKPPVAQLMDDLVNYRNLSYRGLYMKKLRAMEPPAAASLAPEAAAPSKQQAADSKQQTANGKQAADSRQ
ncbi:MAG TPA: hypothetical protein VFG28_00425, partial [Syntrophales bacterium]|nr:hypothetical protein [Syntrophales bacterium]